MLLFAPSGKLIGEVKDLRFWKWRWFLPYFMDRLFPGMYGLYNDKGELTAQIHLGNGKDGFIKIYENDELLGFYIRIENDQLSDLKGEFVLGDEEKMFCAIRSELNGEMRFYDQTGKTVCGLKKVGCRLSGENILEILIHLYCRFITSQERKKNSCHQFSCPVLLLS